MEMLTMGTRMVMAMAMAIRVTIMGEVMVTPTMEIKMAETMVCLVYLYDVTLHGIW